MDLYPKIGLHEEKFKNAPKNFWTDKDNRKNFFNSFAKSKGFDPLIPENWYSITVADILPVKGGPSVLRFYKQALKDALLDVYPFIGLKVHLFETVPRNYWTVKENRKKFFDDFALEKNFDANDPQNWYSVSQEDLLDTKLGGSCLRYYNGSVSGALKDVYPQLPWVLRRFKSLPKNYWANHDNRKRFFDDMAEERGFDPLQAENWSSISRSAIRKQKGAAGVLEYYESISKALEAVYPSQSSPSP